MSDWAVWWRWWWSTVSPEFLFLLSLAFGLAALGLLADVIDDRWPRKRPGPGR